MKLSVSKTLLLTYLSIQCIHFAFINADCPAGWNSRTDSSGIEYGYQVVLQKNITFSQAQSICSGLESDIVSIHSKEENEFIYGLIKTSGVVLFIGMQQKSDQYSPTCSFTDKSECNFGNFNGVKDPKRQEYPWVRNPSITTDGNTVHCVGIADTTYNVGKPNFKWNDVGCNDGLDGTICKKKCIGGNSGGSASNSQTAEASKASTILPANTGAPVVSTKSAIGGGSSFGPVVTSKPSGAPVVSTKPAIGGGSSIGPVVTSKPSGAPVVSTKPAIVGGSSIGPVVTAQSPKTFATLLPGLPGSTPKPVNGGGNNGSCGNCNCNDGYKCGSDDWQVKHGKDGSFAYKYFPAPNSSYFTAKAICAKYHALPCSINSEEENEFLLENVANNQLKSKKRAKRETQDKCIWTGVHIVVSDNDKEENECYCDDGKECSYGHKKKKKEKEEKDKKKKDKEDKKKEKEDKKKEEKYKKKEKEDRDKKKEEKEDKNKKEKEEKDKKKKEKEDKKKQEKEEKDKKKKEKEDKKKQEKENKDKKKKEKEDKKKREKEEKDKKKKDKKDKSKDDSDEDDHKKCSCKDKKKPPSPWAPGCPSKPGGGDKKHCVGIGNDGKWKDVNCEKPGTGIICKRPCSP
uniref:C-type lectin domain-containing protein n=1 Tax=Meloidogyne javanica TaxID=6303 RepID=A0A915LIF1_MELJA